MEVETWREDHQLTGEERRREQGRVVEGSVLVDGGKIRIGKRERDRHLEEAELRRKYRAIARRKRAGLLKTKSHTVAGNVEENQRSKIDEYEERQQRDILKDETRRGKKKPPSPSETKEDTRYEEDDDRSDRKRRVGKRPRFDECLEQDFNESCSRKTLEKEEEKEEWEEEEEEEEENNKKEGEEKGKEEEEKEKVEVEEQKEKDKREKNSHESWQERDVWAFTASEHDVKMLQKMVNPNEINEELQPREEFTDLTASECACESEELKVIDNSVGVDGEGVCRSEACLDAVIPRPRHSQQTVSIWALPLEEPRAVKLTGVKPQDIVSNSLMEIRVAGLRGERGSVTDPRLGPAQVGSNTSCSTCTSLDCLGHSGYIDLREYVFHPSFVMRCVQTLRKLCYHCLGPAVLCQRNLDKTRKVKVAQRRQPTLTEMWLDGCAAKPVEEPSSRLCAKKQPRYRVVLRDGVKTVEVVVPEKEHKVVDFSASTIRAIFAEVPEHTWHYLGMNDPSDKVFLRYLRVPPTSCRSAAEVDGHFTPSPLTVLYNDVVTLRNELDHINQQIEELMAGQEEVVRGGVRMLLNKQVDALAFPDQPAGAPAVVLDEGRGASCAPEEDDNNEENPPRKRVNFAADTTHQNVSFIPDAPLKGVDFISDALPKAVNLISEDELEGMEKGDEKYLDNSGKVEEEADEATIYSTPPLAEWLLVSDDDAEVDISGCEKQKTCKEEDDEEEAENSDALRRTDRLRHMRQQVQKVAAQVLTLHQQARKQHLAITSTVATVVKDQVSKIPGKQGVVRHHMLGKRVNQCARAVFTGDNSLPLGMVGVPRTIATKLFQYVHVHKCNMKEYEEMIDRFPEYPCVVSVIRKERHFDMQTLKDKMAKYGNFNKPAFRLQVGDVVQRHLMNGDQVVVNRQPTLAKANAETHKVLVIDSRTISLNISITDNYAADCDGDEMNLFIPGVESHSSRMLDVSHNTIFSKSGKVSQRIKQDALRGAYTASLRDTFFTLEEFTALAPSGSQVPPPALLKPRRLWTGLQLLSLALPPSLTVDQVGVGMQLDTLLVRHGHLLSGVFDKGSQDKILECCKMFLGHEAIMTIVKRLQGIAERYVDEVGGIGFSFVPEDWSCPADTLNTMRQELQEALSRAQNIQCPQRRNAKLRQLLADQAHMLVPQLTRESNAAAMLKAGSKKRPQKLAQVCLAVGQHNQNDKLPPKHLDGRRLLPFFSKNDTRPQAEGFVDQPLFGTGSITADALSGMVARSSSYKKHCATGESGYLQRKLGKLMEDLTVRHDGTVRDANDEIVQLLYGDDGLLPDCCFTVTLRTDPLPDHVADFFQELIGDHRLPGEEHLLLKKELWSLWSDQNYLNKASKDCHIEASVPFHLPHLMAHVLATVPASGPPPSVTDIIDNLNKFFVFLDDSIGKPMREELQRRKEACEMVVKVRRLLATVAAKADYPLDPRPSYANGGTINEVNVNRELAGTAEEVRRCSEQRMMKDPLDTLKRYVRQHINTYNIRRAAFSRQQFYALLETMTELYQESRPAAGECVGALAAQALAEPLMQMTLNACHRAAVASDGDAIPRLTELLNGQAEDALLEVRQGGLLHAREYLIQEISQVYSLSGEAIDVRHVRLVVDYMLKEGTMRGYTRHHIPPQVSFLKAAAFEQPLSLLQHAGAQSRSDDLLGVSENLILDKAVNVGPGAYDMMTWIGLQRDACTPPLPQPKRDAQHSYDELQGASHESSSSFEDRGQRAYLDDDDDDDDTISIPELDEDHGSRNRPCHSPPGTGQGGSSGPASE